MMQRLKVCLSKTTGKAEIHISEKQGMTKNCFNKYGTD